MKDLAPEITRQRLLIEGLYSILLDQSKIEAYLLGLADHLNLHSYGNPLVHAPEGIGKQENQGFDAFLPLIDSGISLYVWTSSKFFATVLFTCKAFDTAEAIAYTCQYFATTELQNRSF